MSDLRHIWVVEIGILSSSGMRIERWEPWSAHLIKSDAIRERDKSINPKMGITRKFILATQRIRKYRTQAESHLPAERQQ